MSYRIRKFLFHNRPVSILLQDVNGPCPLIAIINVLSLRGNIVIPDNSSGVLTSSECRALISSHCANLIAKSFEQMTLSDSARANVLQNYDDLAVMLDRIEQGLDLNPVLNDVFAFEFTREVGLFDACDIRVAHGWTYDPQDKNVAKAIGNMNYNEATTFCALEDDKIVQAKDQTQSNNDSTHQPINQPIIDPSESERASIIQTWLKDNPTQLTHHGLSSLSCSVKENEVFIFLRNSHFNVVTKYEDELYLLVTDEGLVSSCPLIAWNRVIDVDGSDVFCDQRFRVPSQTTLETCMQQQINPQTASIHTHLLDQPTNQSTNQSGQQQSRSRPPSPNPGGQTLQYRPVQAIAHPTNQYQSQPTYQSINQPLNQPFQQPSYQQPSYQHLQPTYQQSTHYPPNYHPNNQQYYQQQPHLSPSYQPTNQSANQSYQQSYPIIQHSSSAPQQPQYRTSSPQPTRTVQPVVNNEKTKRSDSCNIM